VLRYLPTNLSQPEIAAELHVSRHTVRTHMSHLYAKLGAHSRTEAVERARALGMLAPTHPTLTQAGRRRTILLVQVRRHLPGAGMLAGRTGR
jgi:predicted ArsR family transcriptional regulator